jgi:cell division protein FtsW (lipid II flippase)
LSAPTPARETPVAEKAVYQALVNSDQNRGFTEMGRQAAVALYGAAMVALIVSADFAFFRNRFWERLTVNIGIVLVFAAFYLRFLRRP